jgi:hypothetical protein
MKHKFESKTNNQNFLRLPLFQVSTETPFIGITNLYQSSNGPRNNNIDTNREKPTAG